ncbi:MBL fold metallo-hydrolase [uncultured Xylophilus sp.]|uniref:MBL fold metallo-hydrolase n=1 Tax=uncultured Xylophilus sp. TaxID=296832 RepID=UPI0025EE976F|nr:MBL fold metallo-hydrolase [uncultured Xylophilus sp.]
MNALEQQLHYPLGDTLPAAGTALEVAPGLRWVRMGLPFALDHVNLWLVRDRFEGREGWTVVDTCIDAPHARDQWQSVFDTALDGLPVVRVLVTHMHPDHIGLAHWLCARWDAPLWISATDYYAARLGSHGPGMGGEEAARFFGSHGLAEGEALAKIRGRIGYYKSMVPDVPRSFRRLMDGDTIALGGQAWRCISGYGHAPEHIALYCAATNILLGGDMMLPRISTNVSVFDAEPEADALSLFLRSIERFRDLPDDVLALPAHGKPFRGVHTRIDQLQDHHRERLADLLAACTRAPQSAADVLPLLFHRALDVHQMTFAMGEAVAHLHALWHSGQVVRERGGDGVWRFRAAAA